MTNTDELVITDQMRQEWYARQVRTAPNGSNLAEEELQQPPDITESGHLHFYDSASPYRVPQHANAATYVNGYSWSQAELNRMSRIFRVSVRTEASWAHVSRCIDVENGAATPWDAVLFCRERHAAGHNDFVVYASESNMPTIVSLLRQHCHGLPFLLWVAAWDNNPGNRPVVDGIEAWAKQYWGGNTAPYEISVLYGADTFVKP